MRCAGAAQHQAMGRQLPAAIRLALVFPGPGYKVKGWSSRMCVLGHIEAADHGR